MSLVPYHLLLLLLLLLFHLLIYFIGGLLAPFLLPLTKVHHLFLD